MAGTALSCKPHGGEGFGKRIIRVGDVSGDAIADFIFGPTPLGSVYSKNTPYFFLGKELNQSEVSA